MTKVNSPVGGTPALALLFVLSTSSRALADEPPDPFEDYKTVNPDAPPVVAVRPKEVEAAPKAVAADGENTAYVPFRRGSWLVGAGLAFSLNSSSNELVNGTDASNSNHFMRLQAHGGYFLIDRLQLGLGLGMMRKSLGREAGENSTETDFFFELNAHYVLPIVPRFAFTPGVGMGLYFGGSDRRLYVTGPNNTSVATTETTSTFGFHATLDLLFAYQLSPGWQLRSGLMLSGLVGSESVDSASRSLSSSAFTVGLPLQVNYTFR